MLGLELAAGQAGQHRRVTLPGDQRLQHVPHRQPVQLAGHARHLDQRILQQLLQPLIVPGALLGQVSPQPGVVPQPPDLSGGHEAGPQHAPLGQLRQPDRIQPVGLGPARNVLDLPGVDQLHAQAPRLQQIHKGAPVVGGGLHRHLLDPQASQLPGQLADRARGGRHLPHLGQAPTRPGRMRHPGAHHPRRLGHIDRGHPLPGLLVLLILDLLRLPHRRVCLLPSVGQVQGRPGASVGNRKSDRRARSTVRDPSRSKPQRQTESTGSRPRDDSGVGGQPDHIFALTRRPRGTPRLTRKSTVSRQAAAPGAAQRSRVQAGSMRCRGQAAGWRVTL